MYAKCISRFRTNGIDRKLAARIIEKDLKKDKFDYIINCDESRSIILCGEFGVGKSYAVDIMFQKQAKAYLNDLDDRLPIFLKISSIHSLKTNIEKEYFFDSDNKYIIFIDGLDELDYSLVDKVIDEVMFLEELWDNCYFILTTRPMSSISNDNIKYLPVLKETEIVEIIEYISGKKYSSTIGFRLDKDIKNAIERPFFCILFAVSIRDNFIFDRNRMIDYLVNKSIAKLSKQKEKTYNQIIKLAIIFIDKKLGKIHFSELENNFEIDNLLKSGLIYKDDGEYLYFPLPIIPQWLSAEGIRLKYKNIAEIVKSEQEIIKWRYPLSILFGKLTYNESKDIFGKIVMKYPGIASIIIRDGIKSIRKSDLPNSNECGKMLQECMRKWVEGLGKLAYVIAPFKQNKIADLGVDADGIGISVAWNQKSYNEEIKSLDGRELLFWGGNVRSHVPIAQSIWPWVDTLEYLRNNLEKIIKQKPLLLEDGILLDEYIWDLSCKLTNRGSLYDEAISICEIEKYRKYSDVSNLHINHMVIDMKFYFKQIDKLINRGEIFISAPWPKHDISYKEKRGWVWDTYSDERILEKTIFIYDNALKEYLRIVEEWFPLIKENLSLYNLLPVKLNGDIRISRESEYNGGPSLGWYYEILPKNQNSYVDFSLIDSIDSEKRGLENDSQIRRELRIRRREKIEWIHFSRGSRVLDIFGHNLVTNIVFEWLKDDLKKIGLIK